MTILMDDVSTNKKPRLAGGAVAYDRNHGNIQQVGIISYRLLLLRS